MIDTTGFYETLYAPEESFLYQDYAASIAIADFEEVLK